MLALGAAVVVGTAEARELTYGSWVRPRDVCLHPMGIGGPAMVLYLNRNTWSSLTPDEKRAMVRGGALGSAMQAINTFGIEGEKVLARAKDRGTALNHGSKDDKVDYAKF